MRFPLLAALAAALATSCAHADLRPVLTVAVEHGDTATALPSSLDDYARDAVGELDRGDPTHHWVYTRDAARADRVLRHAPDEDARPRGWTSYERGRSVYLMPARIAGGLALEAAEVHGLLHTVDPRLEHVCHDPGELPDAEHPRERCSPVGTGDARSNPRSYYPHGTHERCNPFTTVCPGRVYATELTDLDRAELERVAAGRR